MISAPRTRRSRQPFVSRGLENPRKTPETGPIPNGAEPRPGLWNFGLASRHVRECVGGFCRTCPCYGRDGARPSRIRRGLCDGGTASVPSAGGYAKDSPPFQYSIIPIFPHPHIPEPLAKLLGRRSGRSPTLQNTPRPLRWRDGLRAVRGFCKRLSTFPTFHFT